MRFIHAADVHLDSPLYGLSAYPDAPAELLRNATRRAFERLVDRAIDEQVDFMVIAGDLYDGNWRDHNTGIFFCKEMGRLKKAGIKVFVLYGNHDAENEMTKRLLMPDNVTAFSASKPQTCLLDDLKVALHGHSFKVKATTANLVPAYPQPVPGYFNIGVLHTGLGGYGVHLNYAPCSIDELHAKGYDYWALGHVHDFKVWEGSATIVFPGNLQGRNIREQGAKGAVLVTVEDGRVDVQQVLVDVLRWQEVRVDAAPCATLEDVIAATARALDDIVQAAAGKPHAVRLVLHGRSAAHGTLFGSEARLRAEVLATIAAIGNEHLWLEKVGVETAPLASEQEMGERHDAIADLHALLQEAQHDPDLLQQLQQEFAPFLAKLPHELFAQSPELQALREGRFSELVGTVSPGLLAYLAEA
ncbi:MAG: metallophosphoesterase [Paucimonas sp.]|nr:metallophosphoesterase [Paucimonas sp.]